MALWVRNEIAGVDPLKDEFMAKIILTPGLLFFFLSRRKQQT
jgi:hypothetical protein